jgi:hypothetical protein
MEYRYCEVEKLCVWTSPINRAERATQYSKIEVQNQMVLFIDLDWLGVDNMLWSPNRTEGFPSEKKKGSVAGWIPQVCVWLAFHF